MKRNANTGVAPSGWMVVAGALVTLGLAGCAEPSPGADDAVAAPSSARVDAEDLPDVLATVEGEEIRLEDLPEAAVDQLHRLENTYRQQRFALLNDALNTAISDRMFEAEAERRGITVAELVAQEASSAYEPTDADVDAWYVANQGRLGGRSLESLRGQIREFLRNQAAQEAGEAFDATLREGYAVEVFLDPYRVPLNNDGAPVYGDGDAEVTLVEFSDFECPFCARFFPTLKRVQEEYGDRVNIVYRQFPLTSIHPMAFKAAEASLCAHEQGDFWTYHDALFAEQDRLGVRDLKEKAGRLGLDQGDFDRCLDTGRYVEQIQADLEEGRAAGVTGTPALFVNGIPVPGGAVPFETVAEALDAELARVERARG